MKLLLETDETEFHQFEYIWGEDESGWSCLWCRNMADKQWEHYGQSLEDLKQYQTASPVVGDSPIEAYPKNKFREITNEELFALLL